MTPKMTKVHFLCLIVACASFVQFSFAAPHFDGHEANDVVDEIIMKLKQLKQGEGNKRNVKSFENVCGDGK